MVPLLELDVGKIVAGGMFPDLPPNQTVSGSLDPRTMANSPVWAGGQNMLFVSNGVQKLLGVTQEGSNLGEVITNIVQAGQDGPTVYTMSPTVVNLYASTGASPTNIAGTVNTDVNPWSLTTWGDWAIFVNDANQPRIYKPEAGKSVTMAGVLDYFQNARLVKKLKNIVIFLRTNNSPSEVVWSELGDPEKYDPVEGGYAGSLIVRDLDSPIVAAQELAGSLIIYTSDALITMAYVDLPDVWSFTGLLQGAGAVSDSAIVTVGRMHYGLGPNGFFQTDATTYRYIDEPDVAKWYQANADVSKRAQSVGFHHKLRHMVCWFFPCVDGKVRGLGFKYTESVWTILNVPVTAAADESQYNYPLVATGVQWGYYDKVGLVAVEADLTTMPFNAGKPEQFKRWDLLRTQMFDRVGVVNVRFGFSDKPVGADSITDWTPWQALAYENWITRESPYITMQLQSTDPAAQWRLGGLALLGEVQGYRV